MWRTVRLRPGKYECGSLRRIDNDQESMSAGHGKARKNTSAGQGEMGAAATRECEESTLGPSPREMREAQQEQEDGCMTRG